MHEIQSIVSWLDELVHLLMRQMLGRCQYETGKQESLGIGRTRGRSER
jgi:hypothetical protein